ncbi:TPA: type I restriction endonuclease subunit R [Staphylococcus aureus]|nr:type I restriction endonuclease subunit R [Staphylococcus aureus]
MAYQSEYALENEMMNQLEQLGYERVTIRDNKQLLDNFRSILNERHADKLEGNPLTDKEFQRLLTMIDGKSIFESVRILRDKLPLRRDDESEIYLSFLDTKSWCKNKFQVTNQVSVEDTYKARYDVTILINGLPLVQVELKRRGIDINEAFNQVKRYRKQNYTGLFRYIQMFIISNGVETRYFSNNDSELLKSHMFYWSDKQNNRINTLQSFAESFMRPCQLAKMISRYMIINETDRILMAMRPYQVYAIESLIVTTIQKMAKAIQGNAHLLEQYKTNKVVFIIDECHRSQFGDMHRLVKQHFKNAQYFGFTGTPRFPENSSQDGRTTADIFGRCLHTYLIRDAIHDGNVFGFSVDYINTFKNKALKAEDNSMVEAIDTEEVWLADKRVELVTRHIINNHDKYTRNRQYSSIFTVQSIHALIKYYETFKRLNKKLEQPLTVAGIFTFKPNEDDRDGEVPYHSREKLEIMISDYNKKFETNFSTDTTNEYFNHISKNVKKGVKDSKIDILIVVNMFLTGFDSKVLNTLYVDKNLMYHDLIQAYSRTNRVEKESKPFGKIVNYRDLKKETDDALRVFSQTNDTDTILMRSYEEYKKEFMDAYRELKMIVPTPHMVDDIQDEEELKRFVEAYRLLAKIILRLKAFDEFEFTIDEIGMDEQENEDYKSKYLAVYDQVKRATAEKNKVSILNDIDFEIEMMRNDTINVNYIMNILRQIDLEDKAEQRRNQEQIRRILDHADDPTLRLKRDLIREFIDNVVPSLNKDDDIDQEYVNFESIKKEAEFKGFAGERSIDEQALKTISNDYQYSGVVNPHHLKKMIGDLPLKEKRKARKAIESFVAETTEKYGV